MTNGSTNNAEMVTLALLPALQALLACTLPGSKRYEPIKLPFPWMECDNSSTCTNTDAIDRGGKVILILD